MQLLLFTPMTVTVAASGKIILSQKFIEGVKNYLKKWPGTITVIAQLSQEMSTGYMDSREVSLEELPFQLHLLNFDQPEIEKIVKLADLVVASLEYNLVHLASLCKRLLKPLIYVSEYTFKTQCEIMCLSTSNYLLRWRRYLWLKLLARSTKKAIKNSAGLQCNGLPTYEAYYSLTKNPLLFFDSRVSQSQLASANDLEERKNWLLTPSAPLRLAFSGRLIAIKGVEDLVLVAQHLKKLKVKFQLELFGAGELEEKLKTQVKALNLEDYILFKGNLNFEKELIPYLKKNCDLFVCLHKQGDPSCTYLETLSCGIPIIGYDNEAFLGLVNYAKVGWVQPLNKPNEVAKKIAALDKNRQEIYTASLASLHFAAQHTMEKTFEKRVEHFLEVYLYSIK